MNFSLKNGKHLFGLVVVSIIIFLVIHNFTEPFKSHPNKILENIIRIIIFLPLLYYTYQQKNWARLWLGGICLFLFLTGFIALFYFHPLYNGIGGVCFLIVQISLFTAFYHLLFSKELKDYLKFGLYSEE
jgi:hypothetical protein